MKITAYEYDGVFDELASEWNALLERSAMNTIFSTWEWQSTWWRVYKPGTPWILTCRDETNRLLGIAPWFMHEGDEGKVVSAIGCVDVTDYLDVIIDKDCIGAVMERFAAYLSEQSALFDRINLCNIPEASPTFTNFPKILHEHGFTTEIEQLDVAPSIRLPDDWQDYLSMLDKKQRHELRRKMRRAGGGVDIDWYIVGEAHDMQEQLELFLKLMAASDEDKEIFLQDENNITFFRELIPLLHKHGWVQLNFLTVDGVIAAAYLNLDYSNHILVYNSGLLRGEYDSYSPGIVLLANNIRYAIENNYEVFDFLRGNEPYKYHLGGKDTAVFALKAQVAH
ncbi:MAG: GNAT family N-acetyltransferase [Aggregatilineales bacterium]